MRFAERDIDQHPHESDQDGTAMQLLEAHIPLTLLLDLIHQAGPPSAEIMRDEALAHG
jgi:hypothetical protein